jgi:hypothetical protein
VQELSGRCDAALARAAPQTQRVLVLIAIRAQIPFLEKENLLKK